MAMNVHKVAIIAILATLCIVSNYALVSLPNVKIMDFLVFIGGICFGPITGALIGILSWTVYGVINPYGFVLQVWLATMISESIYGLVGGFIGKIFVMPSFDSQPLKLSVFFGVLGCILTLIYDSILNVVYALVFSVPVITAMILGIPFQLFHIASNVAIFSCGSIPLIRVINKLIGDKNYGVSSK